MQKVVWKSFIRKNNALYYSFYIETFLPSRLNSDTAFLHGVYAARQILKGLEFFLNKAAIRLNFD